MVVLQCLDELVQVWSYGKKSREEMVVLGVVVMVEDSRVEVPV